MDKQGAIRAMVLAAGVGSRLDPLTQQLPKPLVPIANRPVMEHILCLLKRHEICDVISNTHYMGEMIHDYFGNGGRLGINLQFVHEQKLSGDAGGVRACRRFLDGGTFVVVMGDLVTDMDLSYVIQQHKDKAALATIALKQVEDVERFGVVVLDQSGFITGFQEKPERSQAASNLASTGVYVFEPEIFDYIPAEGDAFFGRQLFPLLLQNKLPVLGVQIYAYWSDVGTIAQYRSTTFDAIEGLVELDLHGEKTYSGWVGEKSRVPESTIFDGAMLIGKNSHIADGVQLKGRVVIGDNCLIEEDCSLDDVIIWSNTTVGASSKLKHSVVGTNCYVEPGSRFIETAIVEPRNQDGPVSIPARIAGLQAWSVSPEIPRVPRSDITGFEETLDTAV